MKKVICFGAAGGGKRLYHLISERYDIVAFADNDVKKWGKKLFDVPIFSPETCFKMNPDLIVITSAPGLDSIRLQLINNGIEEDRIITSYVEQPLISRKEFLFNLSLLQRSVDIEVEVAEAGVFQGDFAECINRCYPNRKLHLFDTFEGFVDRDIKNEREMSQAKQGDYSNTTVEVVKEKMLYPQNVIIHKGYFPETAKDVNSRFCFVNLDLDLYEPTYQGLRFFSDKVIHGGVILVHDYFADNFKGPKEAVDKFIRESEGKYYIYPIGDGISVMVVGF